VCDITLVVMAAGIGARYGGLKQIDPIGPNGEIILDYSAYDAIRAGFNRIVFVIRRDIEQAFRDKIGRSLEKRIDVTYVYQELTDLPEGFSVPEGRTKPWGTGHAVLSCKGAVDTPFGVINADDFYGAGAYAMLAPYLRQSRDLDGVGDYCMVGYELANTLSENGSVARGICDVSADGFLVNVTERTRIERVGEQIKCAGDDGQLLTLSPRTIASMNFWGFTPSFLEELDAGFAPFLKANADNMAKCEYFLPSVVDGAVKAGRARVRVLETSEKWYGVTYQEDRPLIQAAVRDMIARGVYPETLWDKGGKQRL